MTYDSSLEDFYKVYIFKDFISNDPYETEETMYMRGHIINYIEKNILFE